MNKSLLKGIILIIISALLTSFGQLFWKLGTDNGLVSLLLGFILYGIGALTMIVALRFGELSILHPLMCIGYVFALVNGYIFLGETVTMIQLLGILIIIVGVWFIAGGRRHV